MNLQENILRIKEVMGIKTPEQNIIVEASKKDILVNKIGFSEKNAEFLVSLAGPFSVWIANKLLDWTVKQRVHMIKKTGIFTEQQKEEMINDLLSNAGEYKKGRLSNWNKEYEVPGYDKSRFQEGYEIIQRIRHIMDWIRVALNGNVKPYKDLPLEELTRLSTEWHESLEVSDGEYNYNEENEIVRDYRDENGLGFYWVNLDTNRSLEECKRMGHCATTTGNNTLLSLRKNKELNKDNTHNKSYLTAALGKEDGLIYQLKGPKNSKPSEKFHEYIVDLILNYDKIKGFGEEEWGNERDFKITDLPKQEIVKVYSKKPELFNTKELKNYLKNELGGESADPNDVSVEDKSLQENISRIKVVMKLNEQFPEGIDPKDLDAKVVPIDNVKPEETPNEEEPKDFDDFSNSVVPQIVWRAGRVGVSPKGGGIWFGETKKDVENFAWSVRDERREGLPYYINLQNPRYYKNFWNDYLIKAKGAGRDVLMNALINAGYDGIIIDTDTWNDTADEYAVTSKQFIVFDPKNVKPA